MVAMTPSFFPNEKKKCWEENAFSKKKTSPHPKMTHIEYCVVICKEFSIDGGWNLLIG